MSTLMLRSCNCVKWRPPKKHGPSCNNRCHFPKLILCRDLSMLSWCALIAIPTCHLLAHTPRGPVGSVLPQVHLAALREAGVAYSGSSRTLGSPCMNAFSPSAKVPSDVVDARICSVLLMDDISGVGHLQSRGYQDP